MGTKKSSPQLRLSPCRGMEPYKCPHFCGFVRAHTHTHTHTHTQISNIRRKTNIVFRPLDMDTLRGGSIISMSPFAQKVKIRQGNKMKLINQDRTRNKSKVEDTVE